VTRGRSGYRGRITSRSRNERRKTTRGKLKKKKRRLAVNRGKSGSLFCKTLG